jgi:uncharacterized delta-60 repeat protein
MRQRVLAVVSMALVALALTGASQAAAGGTAEPRALCSDAGTALATQRDGRIVVGGSTFTNEIIHEPDGDHAHVGDFAVLRYHRDGEIDRRFGHNGRAITDLRDFDSLNALALDRKGRILAVGSTGRNEGGAIGDNDIAVLRYTDDGRLDRGFSGDGKLVVDLGGDDVGNAVAVDRHGRILIAGRSAGGAIVLRVAANGRLDRSFGNHGVRRVATGSGQNSFHAIAVTGGRILAAGQTTVDGAAATMVVRLTRTGEPDAGFGDSGRAVIAWTGTEPGSGGAMALDRAGRVVVALDVTDGSGGQVGIARFRRDGTLDPTFGDQGRVLADLPGASTSIGGVTIAGGGRPVLAGAAYTDDFGSSQALLARMTATGRLDHGFGDDGTVAERFQLEYSAYLDVDVQPDGRVLAAGWDFSEAPDTLPLSDVAVARYTRDGRPDPSFGDGGKVFTDIRAGQAACLPGTDEDH